MGAGGRWKSPCALRCGVEPCGGGYWDLEEDDGRGVGGVVVTGEGFFFSKEERGRFVVISILNFSVGNGD